MFHLYFGAFDIVLYLGGAYAAMVFANAICDRMDQTDAAKAAASDTRPELAPMQPIDPNLTVPVIKAPKTRVKVTLQ